jgi:hypothetical protein
MEAPEVLSRSRPSGSKIKHAQRGISRAWAYAPVVTLDRSFWLHLVLAQDLDKLRVMEANPL